LIIKSGIIFHQKATLFVIRQLQQFECLSPTGSSGGDVETEVQAFDANYLTVQDVMEEKDIAAHALPSGGCAIPVRVPRGLGCWLRCERV